MRPFFVLIGGVLLLLGIKGDDPAALVVGVGLIGIAFWLSPGE